MIHLRSNQRLYLSEDLMGYVDKLTSDGTIPYQVDFLQFGFAHAIQEEMEPATKYSRHEITTDTNILGNAKVVIEAVAQWYARESELRTLQSSGDLLTFICDLGVSGSRKLEERWRSKSKSQIQNDITSLL
jgi:hypothetical protein